MPNKMANLTLDNNYWNNNVEYLLCGLAIPTDNKILLNLNIWITDTAASVHETAHKEGLQDISKVKTTKTTKMSNGNTGTTAEPGTLSGTICDQ
jgi:hypothetical protein